MKRKSLLCLLLTVCLLSAVFPLPAEADETTAWDTLDRAMTGQTGTTYGEWYGKTGNSGAVYAGMSAGGNDSIQLRSKDSNSGIVTTASCGRATRVVVTWNDSTDSGRTLDVYGKNTAYTRATDLYINAQGTKIGSIVCGQSTELTINGDYAFIGFRSNNGAMYLDKIEIEWKTGNEMPEPHADGFYLIGPNETVDAIDAARKFRENPYNDGEYLLSTSLAAGEKIKVVKVANDAIVEWYPDGSGNEYTVDAAHAGNVTVFFRETCSSEWTEFGGYICIAANFTITCVSDEHGQISTSEPYASKGVTVTVHVEPEEGFELETLTVLCGETEIAVTKADESQYTFIMPEGNVAIRASFKKILQPRFMTQSLLLSGQIGINFYLDLSMLSLEEKRASFMRFAVTGRGTTTYRDDFDANDRSKNGYYCFTCFLNTLQMADTVTATYYYGGGQTVSKVYSVKKYIGLLDQHPDSFTAKQTAAVKAVADLGHYVQEYLQYEKDYSLGSGDNQYAAMDLYFTDSYDIEAVKAAVVNKEAVLGTNADIEKITFSLALDSETAIKVYYKLAENYSGSFSAKVGTEDAAVERDSRGRYVVIIRGIRGQMLGNMYRIVVTTDSGTAVTQVSGLSYVKLMLDREWNPNDAAGAAARNAMAAVYCFCTAMEKLKN